MRSIETPYDGNDYRSLLEARWAVFFDNAGIPFEYEYYGHRLGELGRTWYLPDFWLPEQRVWVEVKPHSDFVGKDIKKLTNFEQTLRNEYLAEKAAEERPKRHKFYVFVGSPYFNGSRHNYETFTVVPSDLGTMLRNVPTESAAELEMRKLPYRWMHCPICERLQLQGGFGQLRNLYSEVELEKMRCRYCREGDVKFHGDDFIASWVMGSECYPDYVFTDRLGYIFGSPRLMKGYKAARAFKAPRKGSS